MLGRRATENKVDLVSMGISNHKVEYSAVCGLVTDCCWHCNSY